MVGIEVSAGYDPTGEMKMSLTHESATAKFPSRWVAERNDGAGGAISELGEYSFPVATTLQDIVAYYEGDEVRLVALFNSAEKERLKSNRYQNDLARIQPAGDPVKARESMVRTAMKLGLSQEEAEQRVSAMFA